MDERVIVNGIEYVRADAIKPVLAKEFEGMPYCMVRTKTAGVFAGYIAKRDAMEVTMRYARRIWYWDGAATLSQLAMEGTTKPDKCKFPCEVDMVILTEAVEIISITEKAKQSIDEVPVWSAE